jgi:exonuclease III
VFNNDENTQGAHYNGKNSDKYPNICKLNNLKSSLLNEECQIRAIFLFTKCTNKQNKTCCAQGTKIHQKLSISLSTAENYDEPKRQTKLRYVTQCCLFQVSYSWNSVKFSLLLSGDIELNPGPGPSDQEISVITYNARGLKDKLKLKRVLNSCYNCLKDNRDTFIMLQETHLDSKEVDSFNLLWRHGLLASPGIGRQHGVVTLFDKSWDVEFTLTDEVGRYCLLGVKKHEHHLLIINIYAPNDHDIRFFEKVYDQIMEYQNDHPDAKIVIGGDFNLVMGLDDSVNRGANAAELASRSLIIDRNSVLDLVDGYRKVSSTGGFPWTRGNCMSRLDMIFLSLDLCEREIKAETNWAFDVSDHASVKITFKIKGKLTRGKGLYRVNTSPLDNVHSMTWIKNEVAHQLSEMPKIWDPHKKLDFMKVVIRSILSQAAAKENNKARVEEGAIKSQLNYLISVKEGKLLANPDDDSIRTINECISALEAELNVILENRAKFLAIRSGAKWYEDGERSNKYFLNLIKERGEQTLITQLDDGIKILSTQKEISEHITKFYKELYEEKEANQNYDDLFSDLPSLSQDDRDFLDRPITLSELEDTLKKCKESAPGPDGIPYKVYKALWPLVGQILLDAWNHSVQTGNLPDDQKTSCITLLPKQGKDLNKIENWRPITLTNCDLKIFTKLIADRVATKLDKLIIDTQTAYIPGRVVHDNLRMFDFYKAYCQKHNVDAVLISLDAKKAFDSVNHKYLHAVLSRYGFSDEFISTVKLLYNDIKASIMINGYRSTIIRIARSVKQGDALSCALFILCMDPLLRKIESNNEIKPISIPKTRFSNIAVNRKTGSFADDVGCAVRNDPDTIKALFDDYALFSSLSGIELNLTKTEFLKLNVDSSNGVFVPVQFMAGNVNVESKESIKICGITYSNNSNMSYDLNISDKIRKFEKQLIRWLPRGLSVEGKILIVKTFGLSQLIYSLQMCYISDNDLKLIESKIFKFLWNKKWTGSQAPDRIKRSTLKLSYEKGGLKVPDIHILSSALKTKQFVRSFLANHPIKYIQMFQLEQRGYFEIFKNEYSKLVADDPVISVYQGTVNSVTQKLRQIVVADINDPAGEIKAALIASTDVLEYLQKRNMPLIIHRFRMLSNLGIETYHELLNEYRFPRNDRVGECASDIISFFPRDWANFLENRDDINSSVSYENEFPTNLYRFIPAKKVTVKGIRELLLVFSQVSVQPFRNYEKFELLLNQPNKDNNPFMIARKALHAPRDKFYKYRILNGDIFCNSRRARFGMTENPNCNLCPTAVETIKHLLWDCPRSRSAWEHLNDFLRPKIGRNYVDYETIFLGSDNPIYAIETMIVWTLKKIISINREDDISQNNIIALFKTLFKYEKQAFIKCPDKFKRRWEGIVDLFED